jgi:hypothetical protein
VPPAGHETSRFPFFAVLRSVPLACSKREFVLQKNRSRADSPRNRSDGSLIQHAYCHMVVWSEGDVMDLLSVTQRPFFYDSVDQTVDRSHTVNRTASAAHHVVDTLADQALTGVGKVSGTLHVAVNHTPTPSFIRRIGLLRCRQKCGRSESRSPMPRSRPSERVRSSPWAASSPSDTSSAAWRADDPTNGERSRARQERVTKRRRRRSRAIRRRFLRRYPGL